MKAIAIACLLLGVVAAAHATEPLFTEYLGAQKEGSAVKPSYYDGAEKETVCFRTSLYCDHACPASTADCNSHNEIDQLVCTDCGDGYGYRGDHHGDSTNFESQLGNAIKAGHCMWFKHETTPVPLAGVTGTSHAGNFYGTCTISTEAGACKLPESCNDITVNVQGVVYTVDAAIRVGPAQDNQQECVNGLRRGSKKAASGDAKKATTQNYIEIDAPPTQVFHGSAHIFTGYAEVYNHGPHTPKFPQAHFQYSWFDEGISGPTDASTLGNIPRLGDDVYRFDFFNQKPAYA